MKRNLIIVLIAVVVIGVSYKGWQRLKRAKHLQTRIAVRQADASATTRPMPRSRPIGTP